MRVLSHITLMAVLLAALGCSSKDAPPLKIGSNIWPGYELYFLARSLGDLDSKIVRLVEFSNATDVSHQLVNGNLQGALLTLDEAIRLQQSGLNLKVVQIVDFSRGGDVVMAQKALGEREELVGKTIAVEGSAVGALMLSSFAKHVDVPIEYLNAQYISVDESEKAFHSGVDFIITFEPFRTKLVNLGAEQVFDSRSIPNLIVDVLVIREDALSKQSISQIKHAISSFFKAKDYMHSYPKEAAKVLAKRLKITPEEVSSAYDGIGLASLKENYEFLMIQPPTILKTVNEINKILVESKLITEPIDPVSLMLPYTMLPALSPPN